MCGERLALQLDGRLHRGSSPRVRGTPLPVQACQPGQRFIPACAGNASGPTCPSICPPVHPRVCGEREARLLGIRSPNGSSPRVRGTRHRGVELRRGIRFIPACAGNASPRRPARSPPAVHPRVCGERVARQTANAGVAGSSPRVRGTPTRQPGKRYSMRFIPACAGNARAPAYSPPWSPVHPRVCGERAHGGDLPPRAHGSSPRVRGTPPAGPPCGPPRRFIPACAGNARPVDAPLLVVPVHPRVCGERPPEDSRMRSVSGSSPRVRGTRSRCGRIRRTSPVHPRVCGERFPCSSALLNLSGSSPRVRGTRVLRHPDRARQRFIPACAGNATGPNLAMLHQGGSSPRVRGTRSRRWPPRPRLPVHPRVCGERSVPGDHAAQRAGSSPRVRGTRFQGVVSPAFHRFIPACAGNARRDRAAIVASAVHPRVCGERPVTIETEWCGSGSSPRVRGTPRWRTLHAPANAVHPRVCGERLTSATATTATARFIPACAGNARGRGSAPSNTAVHPRVCGERDLARFKNNPPFGSSPRVRGTLPPLVRERQIDRFIPACAGNARYGLSGQPARPVHPRVCGERGQGDWPLFRYHGSSPRVRGTRAARDFLRTVPAVHPRVCGERGLSVATTRSSRGSSPRVRGTLIGRLLVADAQRFIPACAGNASYAEPHRAHDRGSSPRVRGTHFLQLTDKQGLSERG